MATREQVANALLAAVQATGFFTTTGRRARDPRTIGPEDSPACFLVISEEEIVAQPNANPSRRTLKFTAFVYNDIGNDPNAYPETALNAATDALEQALVADSDRTRTCTLGGLVFAALIRGQVRRAPAEITGKALALVPIEVVLP